MAKRDIPSSVDFEIINIKPMNKYISECEIKVLHHGQNRNGSYISKAVGNEIANSLPRAPIVALYNEQIDDYVDHGEEITINRDGIKFEKKTIPYGAVDKDTPAVWKKFFDKQGNEREYLVVRGFLWTGRYPHLEKILEKPKGQSMEFFEESVEGNWAKFDNQTDEIFIFNEADISALCILGDDVEPCFEDASIGKPEILYSLKKDEFKKDFNDFMFELNKVLSKENSIEGGMAVEKVEKITEEEVLETDTEFSANAEAAVKKAEESKLKEDIGAAREFVNVLEDADERATLKERLYNIEVEKEESEDFDLEDEVLEEETEEIEEEEEVVDFEKEVAELTSELDELKTNYSLIEEELKEIKIQFAVLQEEKEARELSEKEEICNKFSILGEEALNSFKENLTNYTAEELEKELSVIAFKKGITFNLLSGNDTIVTAAPVKNTEEVPAWVKAVENKESAKY